MMLNAASAPPVFEMSVANLRSRPLSVFACNLFWCALRLPSWVNGFTGTGVESRSMSHSRRGGIGNVVLALAGPQYLPSTQSVGVLPLDEEP